MLSDATPTTFTRAARSEQLVEHTIDALVELGYQQTSIAEVARRAGVSKGVVTYHFPAKDDLTWAVVTKVFESIEAQVGTRLASVPPGEFVSAYIDAWVDFYRTDRRTMLAVAEIWTGFRDQDGHQRLGAATLESELTGVAAALAAEQVEGTLRPFAPRVMAVTLKAALDGLLGQLVIDPELDLNAYAVELRELFVRATSADSPSGGPVRKLRSEI